MDKTGTHIGRLQLKQDFVNENAQLFLAAKEDWKDAKAFGGTKINHAGENLNKFITLARDKFGYSKGTVSYDIWTKFNDLIPDSDNKMIYKIIHADKLKRIAQELANLAQMPYCWEDVQERLRTGRALPFKFDDK